MYRNNRKADSLIDCEQKPLELVLLKSLYIDGAFINHGLT